MPLLYSLHSPGRPLTADVFRDAFDISGHVGRHTIGAWVFGEYQYEGCVLWPYVWHIDGSLFLRRKKKRDIDHRPRYFGIICGPRN